MKDLCDDEGIKKAIEEFNKKQPEGQPSQAGTSSGARGGGFVPHHLLEAFKEMDEEEQGKAIYIHMYLIKCRIVN